MGSMGGSGSPSKVEASPLEVELAKISREKWDRYKGKFRPVETAYRGRVSRLGGEHEGDRAASMAGAGVDKAISGKVKGQRSSAMAAGIRPGSGRMIGMRSAMRRMGAGAKGAAMAKARHGQKDRLYAGMQNALNIGQGQASTAQNSMHEMVDDAVNNEITKSEVAWENSKLGADLFIAGSTLGGMYYKNGRG